MGNIHIERNFAWILFDLDFTQHILRPSDQGLYSLSGKTSYRQISWSLEAARMYVAMVVSLWNLTGTSVSVLPRYVPNFRAIGKVQTRISRHRDFTRSCGKTSYRLVNRGPGYVSELGHHLHYSDVIMSTMASQITGVSIAEQFVQASIQENIKAPRHWSLWGEFTGGR